uniref:glutamine synthetase n=1 Tax=Ditylenchus dipsaci TaxID=166011 RepID=A0A915E8F6_9BILA
MFDQFLGMQPHPTKCQATYVWIDVTGQSLRSKTRTLPEAPQTIHDYPVWNHGWRHDWTDQGVFYENILKPVAHFPDPFLGGQNRLVLCEEYGPDGQPVATNYRHECNKVMQECAKEKPWFGIEQEYMLLDTDRHPLGWPKNGQPTPIDETMPYYCGVGVDKVVGREVVEAHYRACLRADIEIAGTNAEATFGQWEFQIGICEGIEMGDHLWMARYLLHRVAEKFGVVVSLDPMLPAVEAGKWFGSGCHTNFSSASTRAEGGIKVIEAAMTKLALHQQHHLSLYGSGNEKRLTGKLFTPSMQHFTWGVADRAASVRIPQQVADEGKGYLEDRRPSSNCDPYRVTAAIASACLL